VTWPTLAIGATAVAGLLYWNRLRRAPGMPPDLMELALFGLAGFVLLQLLPLPPVLHGFLSPTSRKVWAAADQLRLGKTLWRPLSVDPPGTAFAATTGTALAFAYAAVRRLARDRAGRRHVLGALIGTLLVTQILALAHPLLGLTALYGFYVPVEVNIGDARIFGPLLNPNHAAAAAGVLPPILLTWAMQLPSLGKRLLCVVGAATSSAVAVLALSRGGMMVLALEFVAVAGYALLNRRNRRDAALVAATAMCGVAVALYVAFGPILREAADRDATKLRTAVRALSVLHDYPWTGAGRGAFTSAFVAYQQPPLSGFRFAYVECWPIQLLVDVGVPATIVFVATASAALYRSVRQLPKRPLYFGVVVAVGGLLVHDFFDFSMEFLGLALVFVSLVAWLEAASDEPRRELVLRPSLQWLARPFAAVVGVAAVAAAVASFSRSVEEDATRLSQRWAREGIAGLGGDIDSAWARHPAEPIFPMMQAVRSHDGTVAPSLFLHAVNLGPARPQTHFWFARWFVAAGRRGQAWAEYRQSVRLSPEFTEPVLRDVVSSGAALAEVLTLTTDGVSCEIGVRELDRVGRSADAAAVDDMCAATVTDAYDAHLRIARRLLTIDRLRAVAALDTLLSQVPPPPARVYIARAGVEVGTAAEKVLEAGLTALGEDPLLLEELVRSRGTRLGLEHTKDEIDRLRAALLAMRRGLCRLHGVQGDVSVLRGEPRRALSHYLDAGLSREGVEFLEKAARLAEDLGLFEVASQAWSRLQGYFPSEPRFKQGVDRVAKLRKARATEIQLSPPASP